MTQKITFIIASNTGAFIKKITISTLKLWLITGLFISSILFSGILLVDYTQLKKTFINNSNLQQEMTYKNTEIHNQRKQIQIYANEINLLKSKLVDLNNFERKIRIIANIRLLSIIRFNCFDLLSERFTINTFTVHPFFIIHLGF
jgi:hypothetical protein